MHYSIGLDIGIASVGFAVMELNEEDSPTSIVRIGARVFDVAENPKDGASLALPRREARSARRRTRRRRHRKERVRALILEQGLLSIGQFEMLYRGSLPDIYAIRKDALDRLITNEELARILIHMAQRRGFQSNRKGASTKEDGVLLKAVSENKAEMEKNNYRTVGEMLYLDVRYDAHKRNKGENYLNTVSRGMIEQEVREIFAHQRVFGNAMCTPELEEEYLAILLAQRSFEEGPGPLATGKVNPYAKGIAGMVGFCTFEPTEHRAPKASYSFERFDLLQKINHIRLEADGKTVPLTKEQRLKLISLAHNVEKPTFQRIRKELELPDGVRFNSIRKYEKDLDAAEKKEKLNCLNAYHAMRKALDKVSKNRILALSTAERNEIGKIFSLYKSEERLREEAAQASIEKLDMDALLEHMNSFSKFGRLSVKALDKIVPFLEHGLNYNEACEKAGYNFKGHASGETKAKISLSHLAAECEHTITSPVAKRAISQCAKVINAIIREMGGIGPVYINIELAREVSRSHKDRTDMDKGMRENATQNEQLKNELLETDGRLNPTGLDIVKLKLWKQQDGVCPYSGERIFRDRLFDHGYADIDHIVPYSTSFDDSYKNKILVKSNENRQKGNKLPLQYLSGAKRDTFILWTTHQATLPAAKKRLLLKEELTEADKEGFKERNLQDTKTISAFLYRYLSDYLRFSPFATDKKRHVTAVNGAVTSMLRSRWGLSKVRADGDMHHALDAAVIACTTQGMIQKLSGYYTRRETFWDKEQFPQPYERFSDELIARLSTDPQSGIRGLKLHTYDDARLQQLAPVFVSRMPSRKVSGAAHKETIKGVGEDHTVIKKVPLTALKLNKDGEIDQYYNPNDDRLLYNALRQRLIAFDGSGEKAFADKFYKPKSDGTDGPLVKKVKILEKSSLNVLVHDKQGAADNDRMVRVDVFYIEGDGYYLVPIYVADTVKDVLPNRAIVANKPYDEWKVMNDEDFIFSLYPNDLIYVKPKKPMVFNKINKDSLLPDKLEKEASLVYYKGAHIGTGAITIINHNNSYIVGGLGAKTLQAFEKYQVDVLGNISKVGHETRQGFDQKRR
ncbi:MAG: type II CRISPR RNA-guided endonuclease Cas9 [Oscillospiraceae bacterium]|nr:type II CRISPR RNA-guided endonuclease Cas9 [Oscillospiraceae bacterium]